MEVPSRKKSLTTLLQQKRKTNESASPSLQMTQEFCPVKTVEQLAENVFVLTFLSDRIAQSASAGQFVNIKTDEGIEPLLRRPFSLYTTQGNLAQIIFNVIGKGTAVLRNKRAGEMLDVLGPLGVPFTLNSPSHDTAILVGGGMGVAPMPMATRELIRLGKKVVTILGARTASMVIEAHLRDVHVATDDGSRGFHGNVVDLIKQMAPRGKYSNPKVFACGPTQMLKALQAYVLENEMDCEASLEGPMGCGFGICQGCPVELVDAEKKYGLMCKDGPTFDMKKIRL
ncbi:MAG TPA: dihydroorotate dehydrogenase electron transfer subunit [Bacteroidetes bacterium]|nr:dihydroorotate dehydrogenase electron transfer subunit [Bacteroidota bacterium]